MGLQRQKQQLRRNIFQMRSEFWKISFITLAVASCTILVRMTGILQLLELAAFDRWMLLRSPIPIDDRIVIVGINESDLRTVGQWPISDIRLLELLEKIEQQNPQAIGLDIYRDLPVEPGYEDLAAFMQATPHLIGIQKVAGGSSESVVPPPPVLAESDQVGANDFPLDVDGKTRRAFLYLNSEDQGTVYSLGFHLAWLFLSEKGIEPTLEAQEKIKLGEALFTPLGRHEGGYVRASNEGYQFILNYRGGERNFKIVSLIDVLEDRVAEDLFRDRIVLIGSTAKSLKDVFLTPYSSTWVTIPEEMSGVEIHAHITSAIIDTALGERDLIRSWSEPLEWLWILAWSAIGTIFICRWYNREGLAKLSIIITVVRFILAAVILVGSSYLLFLQSWWIPVIPPLFALLGTATVRISWTLLDNLMLSYQKIEDYATNLEMKVEQRTLELKEKNVELQEALIQLKAAQKQMIAQEKLASLGSLTAGIAHEIRNPLNFVNNFSTLSLELAEEINEELETDNGNIEAKDLEYINEIFGDLKDCVGKINKHGQRIEDIVNSMLMHARDDRMTTEVIDLNQLLTDSVQLVYKNMQLRDPDFSAIIETDYDPKVITIEAVLQDVSRAFLNIFDNACYALFQKQKQPANLDYQGILQVATRDREDTIEVIVRDNGIGIQPEHLDQIFNPFFTTKPPGEGTGLGLSLTYDTIVTLYKGQLLVRSEWGNYAELTLILPKSVQLPDI
ncbi:MAG: CHASE2 domain-containing protein [Jaaginema sp. PMC 1079.18]|nr:CHASE2 domain-containing protein [Jaaginema sp. PMC 1080.18]MEC4851798.1 CHASE2 domain-containing protein [Jaaginema sp. PMC 1079.18]MEC4867413.1 CHASE2 domain-containing protein [Jaaginema sp. PMC 1078.18]